MNQLNINITHKQPEPDRRYRVLVMLQRSDRPKYWRFNCPHCMTPLAELSGKDVYAMTDFYDPSNPNNSSVGIRCTGAYCKYYYHFTVS